MPFFNFSEKLMDSSVREREEGGGEREEEKEGAQEQESRRKWAPCLWARCEGQPCGQHSAVANWRRGLFKERVTKPKKPGREDSALASTWKRRPEKKENGKFHVLSQSSERQQTQQNRTVACRACQSYLGHCSLADPTVSSSLVYIDFTYQYLLY